MMRKIGLALAASLMAVSATVISSGQAHADVNVYTTEGTHTVNGREWRTACEPYSQTKRCRTEIKATQISVVNGKFVAETDFVFNNLTYLPSPRTLWKANPLGFENKWTAADGRKWYTECDNATTGRNGCRSYGEARVIESFQVKGKWNYQWATKWVFNNMVTFTVPATTPSVKPTPPVSPAVNVPDANLRACINKTLSRSATSVISRADAATIKELWCTSARVESLTGVEYLSGLESLAVDDNRIRDLKPLANLKKLKYLGAESNRISELAPLASLKSLESIDVAINEISDVSPLAPLTQLDGLRIEGNTISDIQSLGSLVALDSLVIGWNDISDITVLSKLQNLRFLTLNNNDISRVSPLANLPKLKIVYLWANPITDAASLQPLIDRGADVLFTMDD